MSTLAEIAKLPPSEFRELLSRMNARSEEEWDEQMESDAKSGRLDRLYARLEKENENQTEVPIDEFLESTTGGTPVPL